MILKTLKVETGIIDKTNCYIIVDDKTKEAMVIDPGGESDVILDMLNILQVKIKYIYLTHCHADHIGAVKDVKDVHGGKILVHRNDADGIKDDNISLTYHVRNEKTEIEADAIVDDNDIIHIGKIQFKVIHTPGHTTGSSCLYCKEYELLFSGDTVFRGTWGRTDLPTSSFEDIILSITNKIMILPEETIIYPGHGKATKVKEEEIIYLNLRKKKY